ncbi:TetR/AcrR family transcriptional regulator [Bacillus weihaiensis]|uniref:TetR/AcrR family transcriptional regulator n=1 Tax=Bacillus weihaiensis TaxID=1547283 RepID=UPI002357BCB4|nr:TetR/AcrR family transcriptional regulator [Bacillus weihaiensis]
MKTTQRLSASNLKETIQGFESEFEQVHALSKSQLKIINAAAELFSKNGFENSSTQDIAKEAGVAEITLFRNFKTKKNLLYQLLAPLIIKISSPMILKDVKMEFKIKDGSAEQVLENIFKDRVELLNTNEKIIRVLFRECLSHEEILHSITEHITKPAKNEAIEFVNQRIEQGEFRDVNPLAVVDLLFYSMLGYVLSHQVLKSEAFTNDMDEMIQTMLDLLLNGIKR